MNPTLLGLAAMSIVDRGGIPSAAVAGVLVCRNEGVTPWAFVATCVAAGLFGDMACHVFGIWLAGRPDPMPAAFRRGPTVRKRIAHAAKFIEGAPRLWLVGGRAFALLNQFVPMAAGYSGMRWRTVALWCLLGNVLWIGGIGAAAWWIGETLQGSTGIVKIATGVGGIALAALSLRHVDRRLQARSVTSEAS